MLSIVYPPIRSKNHPQEHIVFDGIFAITPELHFHQIHHYILVVFEDTHNIYTSVIESIQTHLKFDRKAIINQKGMFSFLLYNRETKELNLFRSLTANPVFYYQDAEMLIISNKLQSFKRFSNDLNEEYFRLYLNTELTETEHSPYKGVRRLLPGHQLSKKKGFALELNKFWSMNVMESRSSEEYIEIFSEVMKEILQDYVRDQKTFACELSGGLDSSSICCLADQLRNEKSRFYGYTYIFDRLSDGSFNRETVDIIYQNTNLIPNYLNLSNYWSFKDTKKDIVYYDEPSQLILNYAMFRDLHLAAKQNGSTIVLSGEGGDELLCSSSHYLRDLLFQGDYKRLFYDLLRLATKHKQPIWKTFGTHIFPSLLTNKLKYKFESKFNNQTWQNTGFYLTWYNTPSWIGEKLKKISYQEVESERKRIRDSRIRSNYLRENFERLLLINPCTWVDTNISKPLGMTRVYPFRDQRMIEFIFSIPSLDQLDFSHKKRCIREGFKNVVPQEILTNPDKSNFVEIFRKGFYKEANFINELIQTSRADAFGWIKKEKLQHAIDKFKYGFNDEFGLISKTLGLEIWLRHQGY
jgi:asparagine synthetase B (glutamine-hydrolysing)